MANKHGSLSIDSDNLFPIIKKWLYSDHDIFYRELISNGCDAITKLKKLDMMGEYTLPADFKAKISVTVDPEAKTLTFTDNGLGMTADEVEEYHLPDRIFRCDRFHSEVQGQVHGRSDHRTFRTGLLLRFHGSGRG